MAVYLDAGFTGLREARTQMRHDYLIYNLSVPYNTPVGH